MWQERRSNNQKAEAKPFNTSNSDSEAQRDRARILHSASFRRLQSKTQVLGIGESDFYRTRLTHSLEVAQIGSGICEKLRENYAVNQRDSQADKPTYLEWIPSLCQIEAICLAHDIGHPPFGHGGEVALNYYMKEHGGFEGNGQTLRIVTKLGEYKPNFGIDVTRRTALGLLKYPVLHKEVANYAVTTTPASKINIDAMKPPKCILDDEEAVLEWILEGLPTSDKQQLRSIGANGKSQFKGFDTSIMELADDISYGVHDLEDALALKLVTERQWTEEVSAKASSNSWFTEQETFFKEKLFSEYSTDRKHAISKLIAYFIPKISIETLDNFETPLLKYQAVMEPQALALLTLLKKFVFKNVIERPELQTLEYKGQQMILSLFEVLEANPKRLLPTLTYELYQSADNKKRIICDYISGMTDSYATKLYHKLFSPDIGSIFDRM
ncbi:deoxyguanosinetriphosphate triphosphohydrolase family protein [Psychromonas sp. RZ5]|uniref:anti-phage deoxyguanosine triphosphatase n=1 Tax=Psychromonas algicola TaxID=2555642 RepID=UPI0010678B10|nr:anti-phage deoxyguanosine triphosphatase [Psychromonas sp. RZ5]TEW49569.1 deoxyguanosinetriphosphate triphosphohydrolase family protein [Psychromonas sp. RZ5]